MSSSSDQDRVLDALAAEDPIMARAVSELRRPSANPDVVRMVSDIESARAADRPAMGEEAARRAAALRMLACGVSVADAARDTGLAVAVGAELAAGRARPP